MENVRKKQVQDFWEAASCGESLYLQNRDRDSYAAQSAIRYQLEPEIVPFADFLSTHGKCVLEIGVGLGADHQRFAEAGAVLHGIDLTQRAVDHTRRRLELFGLSSSLAVGDAEHLDFPDESFDVVYSWGVLHHSPNTKKGIEEVYRVLKKGGEARIMIYHKWSMVGFMLWSRYALLTGRPWRSMESIYESHLESPGTKAYSYREAQSLFQNFSKVTISSPLGHGDLLESSVGQRHRGLALSVARKIWPRWLIRRWFPSAGLGMLIKATR